MTSFSDYSDILMRAYSKHHRQQEIIAKKLDIQNTVYELHNYAPERVLFIGFTPLMLTSKHQEFHVAEVSDSVVSYLTSMGKRVTVLDVTKLNDLRKSFDCVVAADEYFTYTGSEESQRQSVELCCALTSGLLITTLKDYKNQDFKSKEFSQPASVRDGNNTTVFLEHHDYDYRDRNAWRTSLFELGTDLHRRGPFDRRAMFFKQLAKYTKDAGAHDFLIHKNLMYKSVIRKNYEHVISIRFE